MLRTIEYITANVASFGWIVVDVFTNLINDIPTIVTVLIGLSIVFLNVARGIQALRKKSKKTPKDEQ